MLLPGYLSAKPAATASSVGFCVGSSPVPRQQYQRKAAGSKSPTANVWAAVGAACDAAGAADSGAADSPAASVPGALVAVDPPQADTRMAPTAIRTSSLGVRMVRIDRSSSGASVTLRADKSSGSEAGHERRLDVARPVRTHHDALDVV